MYMYLGTSVAATGLHVAVASIRIDLHVMRYVLFQFVVHFVNL